MRYARMRHLGCGHLNCGAARARLHCQAALDIREDILSKRKSATEVINDFLKRIADRQSAVSSFLHVDHTGALAQVSFSTLPTWLRTPVVPVFLCIWKCFCRRSCCIPCHLNEGL
jgi:hypothetical protein